MTHARTSLLVLIVATSAALGAAPATAGDPVTAAAVRGPVCVDSGATASVVRLDGSASREPVRFTVSTRAGDGRAVRLEVLVPAGEVRRRVVTAVPGEVQRVDVATGGRRLAAAAVDGNDCYTLLIGDSISSSNYGQDDLLARHPHWVVDGVPGRPLRALVPRLREHLATYGVPRRLVIALGSNEGEPGYASPRVYRRAIAQVPGARVTLVTTWRSAKVFGGERARTQRRISAWMRGIARDHDGVCLAPWRTAVIADRSLVRDGVHPSLGHGTGTWARIVSRAVARCEG